MNRRADPREIGLHEAIESLKEELDKQRQPDERPRRLGLQWAINHLGQRLDEVSRGGS